ncbi:SOS response-associated peptidase [Caenispirillum bisanense]|uniref:SOS response-associated peptidase n=1 Tax=Caenispirillum bisanense TaxID=414052 RepID=UPI0031E0E1E3
MCSRYSLTCAPIDLVNRYGLTAPPRAPLPIPEIRPTDPAPVKGRKGVLLRKHFGIPSPRDGKPLLNARAETLTEKPTFRRLLGSRVLVPATAYYEWRKDGKARHRNTIIPGSGNGDGDGTALFSFAGLVDGDYFAIITCAPAPSIAGIHDRMPVILPREAEDAWISDLPFEAVADLLRPWAGTIAAAEDAPAAPAAPPAPPDLFS